MLILLLFDSYVLYHEYTSYISILIVAQKELMKHEE